MPGDVEKGRKTAIITNSGGPATTMANECGKCDLIMPAFDSETQKIIKKMIPPYPSPERGVRAMSCLCTYAEIKERFGRTR